MDGKDAPASGRGRELLPSPLFAGAYLSVSAPQGLLWTKVHVRTAEQFERWSIVVAIAMNQLVLARSLGQASYRPWERRRQVVTPRQVRRVMPAILQQLGTPARVPKPRGKSPGWPKGMPRRQPERFAVIKKPKPEPKTRRKQG